MIYKFDLILLQMERARSTSIKSLLSDATYDTSTYSNSSIIHVEILEAKNLTDLADTCKIQPYVKLKHLRRSYKTPISTKSDCPCWDSKFDIAVDMNSPLYIFVFDSEKEHGDMILSGLYFPIDTFRKWQGDLAEFWIELDPICTTEMTETLEELAVPFEWSMISRGNSDSPMIRVRINYSSLNSLACMKVSFDTFRIVMRNSERFTVYNLTVHSQGASWNAEVRYSQVYRLREELMSMHSRVEKFPFPKRTYWEFLSLICGQLSRFDIETIRARKQGLERFLNYILKLPNLKTEMVVELLNISSL